MRPRLSVSLFLLAGLFVLGAGLAPAQTVGITGLYTTGVNNSNVLLGNNVQDAHYVITASSAGATYLGTSYTITTPNAAWTPNTASARWIIAPNGTTNGTNLSRPAGTFDYTLTFTMPTGAMLSSVSISGTGAADNTSAIYVNGTLVSGQSITNFNPTNSFTLNGANSTFTTGTNTITFRVTNNTAGTTGFLITSLSGTTIIPEVGAFLPVAAAVGLCSLGAHTRRRLRLKAASAPR